MDMPVPMLEATEDGSETRPKESPAAASKPSVDDRMVYKLVKVGDDGSVLPATEDEVFQSLVSGSGNGLSSFQPNGSDAGEDDEGNEFETDEEEQEERNHNSKTQVQEESTRAVNWLPSLNACTARA